MSASLMRAECRKFVPNIFNKTKCSNCFRQKEEHSAEALECNRATRKISKCGYLFVAPGWDFSDPVNRTKRWQRRWFVLYDDGELSYSVDEHPETVPQASIDMNKVLDVSDAEEITGNSYSLAITAPETVHFVKGTCREEAKWWKDVLNVFPRSKGRHKRNATFPGSQTSAILQQSALSCRSSTDSRPRLNSCHTDSSVMIRPPSASSWLHVEEEEIFPIRDIQVSKEGLAESSPVSVDSRKSFSPDSSGSYRDHQPVSSTSPPTRDKIHTEEKVRTRRTLNRERRGLSTGRSFTEELYRDKAKKESFADELTSLKNNRNLLREKSGDGNDVARRILLESEKSKREEKLKDIAESLTRPRRHPQTVLTSYERRGAIQVKPTRDGDYSEEEKVGSSRQTDRGPDDVDGPPEKPIRGDPDGCGLDITSQRYSPSAELRVDLPAEDLLNIKKGWLMKQASNQDWSKHWFVLRGAALMYYRDPTAEDKGILDGVMDLSSVSKVSELQVQRNYGFQTISWDERRNVLSAVTAGIRNNWMTAIRRAAGLPEPLDLALTLGEKLERELERSSAESNNPQYYETNHSSSRTNYLESCMQRSGNSQYLESPRTSESSMAIPRSPGSHYVESLLHKSSSSQYVDSGGVKRSSSAQSMASMATDRNIHFSSDEDYRTASESSRKLEEWKETPTPLPPSPPLNRTPISRVKERAKTQTSRSRVYNKRSKSSPPSSRRNTLDSIRTEDVLPCTEKREEPLKRSIIFDKVDRHLKEIDDLKEQLKVALRERSTAEKELMRLRQRKSEANLQMEELLRTLKVTEDKLKLKTDENKELESLKQRYSHLVKQHEELVSSWRENEDNHDWREMWQQLKDEYDGDKAAWEMRLEGATSMLQAASERCELLTRELNTSEETVEALKAELSNLSERLLRGIEENEGLYGRVRELEGRCLSSSRERGRSVDSLSDLTNIDLDIDLDGLDKERIIEEYEELKGRFEKAIQEIRAMKRELRESHACYDDLELTVINLRQDSKRRQESDQAQAALMASRIEDLTLKLSASEKQVRSLKQKISKSESREKRRSLSLKGRESFQIGRELEEKLTELESKINALELGAPVTSVVIKTATPPPEKELKSPKKDDLKSARLRRKSLDSATSSEPMKVLIRLSSLEGRVMNASKKVIAKRLENQKQSDLTVAEDEDTGESFARAINKLQECRSLMISMKSCPRPSSPLNSKSFVMLENRLLEVENILSNYEDSIPSLARGDTVKVRKSVECVVSKLENLLKNKLLELLEERNSLRKENRLDEAAKQKLLAEKLAYESVLLRKIREAVAHFSNGGRHCKMAMLRLEVQDTCRLMTAVRRKLRGEHVVLTGSSTDYLVDVLTQSLVSEGKFPAEGKPGKDLPNIDEGELTLEQLIEQNEALSDMVEAYKNEKLEELAHSLASETLCLTAEYEEGKENKSSEDRRIRQAWTHAQEALNRELVQAEISHVTMRCAGVFENASAKDLEENFTFFAETCKRHEEYVTQVEESLRNIMDRTVEVLTCEYEKYLKLLKKEKPVKTSEQLEQESTECRILMESFVSILAQKTVIDERIRLLTKKPCCEGFSKGNKDPMTESPWKLGDEEPDLETKFIYLYQMYQKECIKVTESALGPSQELIQAAHALDSCLASMKRLRDSLGMEKSHIGEAWEPTWEALSARCTALGTEIEDVVRCLQGDKPCTRCDILEDTLAKMEAQYDEEISLLRHCHEAELKDVRGELESQRDSLVCQHEQEQAQLMERARRLERRLGTLDAEYSQQMDNLRTAYHKTLSAELEKDENTEDSIRQRYQVEIEQLRALCEKGLIAVDNSHRRIIAELEEKHRQELAAAAAEKEQALAEETQATLAALDAMRKAHETEVQKEINKFKTEFLKKMQGSQDISALHKEHEAEMEEIKKEILSLSEKYSIKCVESASLEEQLSLVSKQLNQAQQHIMQLDARNKQLRAHLVSEAHLLDAEAPRSLKPEDDERTHGITRQSHSLNESRRSKSADAGHASRGPFSFNEYLRTCHCTSNTGPKMAVAGSDVNSIRERVTRWQEPPALSRTELLRSPKCGLLTASSFNSPSLNQLSGMVAERKKLFEHSEDSSSPSEPAQESFGAVAYVYVYPVNDPGGMKLTKRISWVAKP